MSLARVSLFSFFITFVSFFILPTVEAIVYFEDAVFPELVTNARPLAMGNAFLSRVDDSTAVFYNPAGLGTVRWTHFHITNIHMETNRGLLSTTTGGHISEASQNAVKGFNLEGTRQLLLANPGVFTHNRFNIMPNLTTRYFSLGFVYSEQTRATIRTVESENFEFATRQDMGPYAALNLSLFGGVIKMGASGILLSRRELIDERDKTKEIALENSDYQRGKALIVTGGGRFVLPIAFLPTLSATLHNALNAEFSVEGSGTLENIKNTIDLGFSLTPQIGKMVRVHLEGNLKDVTKKFPNIPPNRKVLFGLEFDFARSMFVRFGYGDGFGSSGIGIRTNRLEFDLTTYAVDTTETAFRGNEDRRFAMSISSGI